MRPCELSEGGEMRPKCLEIADEHETVLESKAQRECVYVCVCFPVAFNYQALFWLRPLKRAFGKQEAGPEALFPR